MIAVAGGARGIDFAAPDKNLMPLALPGTFRTGEMPDWEAPGCGYLLTACFGSVRAAGRGLPRRPGRTEPGSVSFVQASPRLTRYRPARLAS